MLKRKEVVRVKYESDVPGAVNDSFATIEELGSEMRDAFDNTPESLQNSGVGEARGEAADALENISEPSAPDCACSLNVSIEYVPAKGSSRRARMDDGLQPAYAAIAVIDERIAALDEKEELTDDEQSEHDELTAYRDEIEEMIEEAESVTFPGMYG